MQASRHGFPWTLAAVALLVGILGLLYSHFQNIPLAIAVPLAAAFAIEAALYLVAGVHGARAALERRLDAHALAPAMVGSALIPFLVYAVPCGVFDWRALGGLAAMAALLAFWYVLLPRAPVTDVAFVALVAAGLLSPVFGKIYASPVPKLPLAILGQLMWTRLAILAALSIGRMEVKGFGFLPSVREWVAGVRNFLFFIPAGVLVGWLTGFAAFRPRALAWWQLLAVGVATFLGMLWVVALREEFFFRGLLQDWMSRWLKSEFAGLLVAAAVFGLLHLPFRDFPNWRFALLATLAGIFYGRAYLEARSVRAAMVTHALVNTAWRVLFS